MWPSLTSLLAVAATASAVILQNGQVRPTDYPNTSLGVNLMSPGAETSSWTTYGPDTKELSYKGRWDKRYISWWSAPGLKFGFTGEQVAISFGNYTSGGTLIAYRIDGMDWQFTNVSASMTHMLVTPATPGVTITGPHDVQTFEMRVTNWGLGVQIAGVHVGKGHRLAKLKNFDKMIEIIGDSLTSGQYATYEGLASYAYDLAAGFGNVEYSIEAYPGICLYDKNCWGNPRGQTYQFFQTQNGNWRQDQVVGSAGPEPWDFAAHQAADLVVINLGTNDNSNQVTSQQFYDSYVELINGIHKVWPKAQVILVSLWIGFGQVGNTYAQGSAFVNEIVQVANKFSSFVHYFNTTGILQHNDIAPQWHPTDVGHIKIASHLQQYIKLKFGWEFGATGPEVQHDTTYWNTECCS